MSSKENVAVKAEERKDRVKAEKRGKGADNRPQTGLTITDCSNCGFCKRLCPVFRVTLEETKGARGRAALIKRDVNDEIYYLCTLCGACKVTCPAGIDLPEEIRRMRAKLVSLGAETEANRKMIENIRKFGNPYGKVEKGKIPKELYCC
jgi:fumarate reductase (CoM/CoB) subunit B